MAPVIADMVFKGIPALFRGIGSLFSRKGKAAATPSHQAAVQEPVKIPEKPKEPPVLTALSLVVAPQSAAPGESVTLTAYATLSDPEASKANIAVSFKATPDSLVRFKGAPQAKTNASGIATISATVRRDHGVRVIKTGDSKAVKGKSDSAHNALDDEMRAMAAESDISSVSSGASERDETIEFGASATFVKSLSASGIFVLSDVAKPKCKFERLDTIKEIGPGERTRLSVRFSCDKSEEKLGGYKVRFTLGWSGASIQGTYETTTGPDGIASIDIVPELMAVQPAPAAHEYQQLAASPIEVFRGIPATTLGQAEVAKEAAEAIILRGSGAAVHSVATIYLGAAASTVIVVGAIGASFSIGYRVGTAALSEYNSKMVEIEQNTLESEKELYVLPGDGLDAPGTCDEDKYESLRGEYKRHCLGLVSCRANFACKALRYAREKFRNCQVARHRLMTTCFNGGDSAHRPEYEAALNGQVNCEKLMLKKGCSEND